MPAEQPVLFVSHGAPTMALREDVTTRFWQSLAGQRPKPAAVICMSAHWTTAATQVSSGARPATIHDFYGFGAELEAVQYAAPGDPALAGEIVDALRGAGLSATADPRRGFDHGVWVPLKWLFPRADVPVVCVSVVPGAGSTHQFAVGQALRGFAARGCLVLGSGGATHNLAAVNFHRPEAPAERLAADFDTWLAQHIESGATQALLDYRAQAPGAAWNHPTEEHLLPVFFALGAARAAAGERIHERMVYEVLSLAAYRWQ